MRTLLRDIRYPDLRYRAFGAEERRQHGNEEPGIYAVEEYLEEAVEGHKARRVLGVSAGKAVPDNDHGYASREPHEYEACHIARGRRGCNRPTACPFVTGGTRPAGVWTGAWTRSRARAPVPRLSGRRRALPEQGTSRP